MVSTHLLKKYTGGTQLERGVAVTAEDQNSDSASLNEQRAILLIPGVGGRVSATNRGPRPRIYLEFLAVGCC
jgi:hypothetical protein